MPSAGFGNLIAAFRHRDYRVFMTGNVANHVGLWTQRMTAGWLAWELTHSATWLGILGFADMAPVMIVGPLSGLLADRMDRLTIIRFSQAVITALSMLLFILMTAGLLTIEVLFFLFVLLGIAFAVLIPARQALVPSLVGPENLHAAIAINSLVANGGRLIGPAIGGVIIVQWGIAPAFAFCATAFVLFNIALWLIRPKPTGAPTKKKQSVVGGLTEAVTYTRRHAGLGPLMLMMSVAAFVGRPFSSLFPAFAAAVFDRGADGLAWFTAVLGAGAFVGGTYLARRAGVAGLTRVFIVNMAAIGAALIAFGMVPSFWLAVCVVAAMGSFLLINSAASQTLIQNAVEEDKRGRLSSFYGVTQRGGQALGALVLGVMGDLIGLQETVIVAGAACLIFWLWSLTRSRSMAAALES